MDAALDGVHHALKRRLGVLAGGRAVECPGKCGSKHQGPILAELRCFLHQGIERIELIGRLVHAHLRHQRAAFALGKALALCGRGVVGQFHASKHEQQALWLGLGAGGQQELIKTVDFHTGASKVQ